MKKFNKLEVLKGIDLDVDEGEVVAVIGPSGGGKSTLLRCLNKLETISAGVRRIEAVTGRAAVESVIETDRTVKAACAALKSDAAGLAEHAEQAEKRISDLEREIRRLKEELAADMAGKLMDRIVEINGRKVIVARVDGVDGAGLRTMCDDLRNRLQSGIVVLGSAEDGKVSLIAAVTKDPPASQSKTQTELSRILG